AGRAYFLRRPLRDRNPRLPVFTCTEVRSGAHLARPSRPLAVYQTRPAAAAAAPMAVAASTGLGGTEKVGMRRRSDTGRLNTSTGQPRLAASRRRARSGLTAYGWPTASSSGRSVLESL